LTCWRSKAEKEKELLKQALANAIGDKNVLFLCDGLDEAHLARQSVVAGIEKLAADGQRLVVTSRPMGYERLVGLEHFQVLPLLPEDARAFSDRWFRALAQARGVPEAKQEGWATERANWLQRQLGERPGLREVARNPLLLTFLAVLAGDEPQRDLPRRRKELYREYVERLFTVWEARRRREGELSLGRLRGEEARRVALWGLYRTAWHLHRAYYGGDEGRWAVRGEIEPLLARDLTRRWRGGTLQAEALAAEVLRFWEGVGLLDVYRLAGQEWLAFRHLTFQEYGAARALAEAYQDDADGLWQCLSPHLLRPQWAGVIPLALAHLAKAPATNLVEHLLAANGGDEDRQPPLFLAAAALAEGAEVTDPLHQRVVDTLLNLARTRDWWSVSEDVFIALGQLAGDGYAAKGLLALARDPMADERVCVEAAEALTRLGWAGESAELLRGLAQDRTVGFWVRVRAAKVLGELGIDDLLALAWNRAADDWKRALAAEALWRLGWTNDAAEAWLALARGQAVEAEMRAEAAETLEKMGRDDDATEAWLALARDQTVEAETRAEAAETLEKMGRTEDAAETWLALAQDPATGDWIRVKAVETLGRLGWADELAEFLLALAQDRMMATSVRAGAATALSEMGRDDEAAEAWLALAQDRAEVDSVRVEAAEALVELGRVSPEVLAGLRALAKASGTPERVRRAAREALKRLEK
jgi:hypothetical protein